MATYEIGNVVIDNLTETGEPATFEGILKAPGIDALMSGTLELGTANAMSITLGHTGIDGYFNTYRSIFAGHVSIDGYMIDLSDGVLTGQLLQYDGSRFIAGTLSDGSMIFPGTIDQYQVVYGSGPNTFTGSDNLIFDGFNLGIGQAPSAYTLEVNGDGYFMNRVVLNSTDAALSDAGTGAIQFNVNTGHLEFSEDGGDWTQLGSGGGGTIGAPITGASNNEILYVDSDGYLAQASGFQFDGTKQSILFNPSANTNAETGLMLGQLSGHPHSSPALTFHGTYHPEGTSDETWSLFYRTGGSSEGLFVVQWQGDGSPEDKVTINNGGDMAVTGSLSAQNITSTNYISVDGYIIDISGGATTGQVLAYNGSEFEPADPTGGTGGGVSDQVNVNEMPLTTTSPTTVATFTPTSSGNFVVMIYGRVVTGATVLTLTLSWTDVTGSQTQTLINAVSQPTGSFPVVPFYFNATTGGAITITATAGTANRIYLSADILQNTGATVTDATTATANTWSNTNTFQNIKFSANNTYSLGDSTNKAKDGYFTNALVLNDVRIYRSGTRALTFDDGAGGSLNESTILGAWTANALNSTVVQTDTINQWGGGAVRLWAGGTGDITIGNTTRQLVVDNNVIPTMTDGYSLGSSSKKWKDGYFSGKISLDGYNIDLSANASSNQALVYNGTSFVAANVANTVSNSDSTLTISPTSGAVVASLNLAHANTWTKSQNVASVALVDGTNISTDASTGNVFTVTLAGNRTLDNPTNLVSGGTYMWIITQGSGGQTLAYGNAFTWAGGITPALSTTSGAIDVISAVYDGLKLRASIGKSYA